ncbi:Golgin IMH1 [Wickerhamiella sorbophila]|uniref:Golgin IMH1 n=1 Tax=Wickerhamiella sorbophila TaxID=45607 RepID=A0A2T0FLK7_9ASCO|nr:Golgin IMH1 [Wickerhamiella sorbophila]PRT55862.1 Golgin IMH1 [Wickerhamiella sorbophila]
MLQRLKQSITDELEQVVNGQKQTNGPVEIIERNSQLLRTQTPDVSEMEFMKDESAAPAGSATSQPASEDATPDDSHSMIAGMTEAEIEGKLRKFSKYEEKYPQLLKAYRIEKKKGELVKLFEKVLSENTPCQTISEPQQMLEFLDGLNTKASLLKQELERVSDSHSRLRKRSAETEADLKAQLEEAKKEIENLVVNDSEDTDLAARLEKATADLKAAQQLLTERESELSDAKQELEKLQDTPQTDGLSEDSEKLLEELKLQVEKSKSQVKELEEELEKTKAEHLTQIAKAEELSKAKSQEQSEQLEAQTKEIQQKANYLETQAKEIEQKTKDLEATAKELEELKAESLKYESKLEELENFKAQSEESKSKANSAELELAKVKEELSALTVKSSDIEKKFSDESAMLKDLETKHKSTLEELESTAKLLEEANSKAAAAAAPTITSTGGKKKKKGGAVGSSNDKLQSELAEKTEALASTKAELKEFKERESKYQEQLKELEGQLSQLSSSAELEQAVEARETLQKALDELKKEKESLVEELSLANAAKEKAQNELLSVQQEVQSANEKIETLEKELDQAQAASKSAHEKVSSLEKEAENIAQQLEAANEKIGALEEKAKLNETELKEAADAALAAKTQLEAIEKKTANGSAAHQEAQKRVEELEAEKALYVKKHAELEATIRQHKLQLTKHKDDLVATQAKLQEFEVQKRTLQDLQKKVQAQADLDRQFKVLEGEKTRLERQIATSERTRSSLEKERADLLSQIRGMQSKVNDAEAMAKAATAAQDGLRRQVDELGMRVSESAAKIDVLRDELADAQRLAHERLLETTSMRQMLAERADGHDSALKEARNSVKTLGDERDQLEQEVAALGQRLVRETEQLRARVNDASAQLEAAEKERARYQEEARELRGKVDSLQNQLNADQGSSKAAQEEVSSLRSQLEASESNAREISRAHALLKKVSEDTQLRLERLQKVQRSLNDDLDALRQENTQLRGRSSSIAQESGPTKSSEQEEYIKNVILGFLEHKDQRKQLLPVLSILLKFSGDDEQRFWSAFT